MGYFLRWHPLSKPARLYLVHIGLLTFSLAIFGLLFNFAIVARGFPLEFLGVLNTVSFAAAAVLSVPLLWIVSRLSLRWSLLGSAALQLASVLLFALFATPAPLIVASVLSGTGAVLFEVTASPFMMRHSNAETRDHLFSANAALRIGVAGIGSLLAGQIPGVAARLLGVGPQSAAAYSATLAIAGVGVALALIPLLFIAEAPRDAATPSNAPPAVAATTGRATAAAEPGRLLDRLPDPWRDLVRHPVPLLQLLVSPALISIGAALLIPYLNLFFRERFAVGDSTLGVIFAALGIATGLASLAGPALSARMGKIQAIVLSQALALPFLVVMGVSPLLSVTIAAALARASLFNMGTPLYDAFAMERTADQARPTVIGLMNGAASIGYAFGPLISTSVQATYGFAPIFVATGVCYTLAVLAKYWFFIRRA